MLLSRRNLSIDSMGSTYELASSASVMSLATDVHENIDWDETEQTVAEVQALRSRIQGFQERIAKSRKLWLKRREEQDSYARQAAGDTIYAKDIYELDFLENAMGDFLNNLEISKRKIGFLEEEVEGIR